MDESARRNADGEADFRQERWNAHDQRSQLSAQRHRHLRVVRIDDRDGEALAGLAGGILRYDGDGAISRIARGGDGSTPLVEPTVMVEGAADRL